MLKSSLTAVLLIGFGAGLSGCLVTVEDHSDGWSVDSQKYPLLSDLEVEWSIDGSSSSALCPAYGIDRWRIEVIGPEHRKVELDCQGYWTTETSLSALSQGDYRVKVKAIDVFGTILSAHSTEVDLYSEYGTERVAFSFVSSDFQY